MTINTIGFIGFGKLAKTLYHGFKHELDNNKIKLLINSRSAAANNQHSFNYVSKKIILHKADIIILAVKPQQLNEIIPDLSQIDWSQRGHFHQHRAKRWRWFRHPGRRRETRRGPAHPKFQKR